MLIGKESVAEVRQLYEHAFWFYVSGTARPVRSSTSTGPTMLSQVVLMSGEASPSFDAKAACSVTHGELQFALATICRSTRCSKGWPGWLTTASSSARATPMGSCAWGP